MVGERMVGRVALDLDRHIAGRLEGRTFLSILGILCKLVLRLVLFNYLTVVYLTYPYSNDTVFYAPSKLRRQDDN